MISLGYVNALQPTLPSDMVFRISDIIESTEKEVNEAVSNYLETREQYIFEAALMDEEISSERELYIEKEGSNVFETIGNAVIAVFKKFQEMISNIIESIKNLGFKHKDYDAKLNALCKGNPDLRDDVIAKFQEAELSITDIKSLKEFQTTYDELVKLSKQKNVDPNSLRGKVDAFKRKFENIDKSAVVKTAGAVTAVIGVGSAALMFKKHALDVQKTTNELNKLSKENYSELMKAFDELKKTENGKYVDANALTKAQIDQNLYNFYLGKTSAMISRDNKSTKKIASAIDAFLKKMDKDKASKLVSNYSKDAKTVTDREKKAQHDTSAKNQREAAEKARASEKARLRTKAQWDKAHPEDEAETLRKAKELAQAQQEGREEGSTLGHAQQIAAAQQRGRNSETQPRGTQKIEIVNNRNKNKNGGNNQKNNP